MFSQYVSTVTAERHKRLHSVGEHAEKFMKTPVEWGRRAIKIKSTELGARVNRKPG